MGLDMYLYAEKYMGNDETLSFIFFVKSENYTLKFKRGKSEFINEIKKLIGGGYEVEFTEGFKDKFNVADEQKFKSSLMKSKM